MSTNLPSSAPKMPTPPGINPQVAPAQGGDEQYDDLGYLIQKEDQPAPPATVDANAVVPPVTPPVAPVVPPAPTEKSVTGYGSDPSLDAPPVVPPVAPVVPPKTIEQMNEEEKAKHLVTETIKDLSDAFDKEKITNYALKHKLTPEALADYVQMAKNDEAESQKVQQQSQRTQRAEWYKQLKEDPEFGGANFDVNTHKVDQMMAIHMPDTKKKLTDSKAMLPPYLMKDFLRMAKALNPTSKFEGGEPPAPPEVEVDFIDEIYPGQNG